MSGLDLASHFQTQQQMFVASWHSTCDELALVWEKGANTSPSSFTLRIQLKNPGAQLVRNSINWKSLIGKKRSQWYADADRYTDPILGSPGDTAEFFDVGAFNLEENPPSNCLFIPNGDHVMQAGDSVFICGYPGSTADEKPLARRLSVNFEPDYLLPETQVHLIARMLTARFSTGTKVVSYGKVLPHWKLSDAGT
jgi:hypothetical protein